MSVQSVMSQLGYSDAIAPNPQAVREQLSSLMAVARKLRLDLRLGPKGQNAYGRLSVEEKAEVWRTIRQDAREMAIKHRHEHAIGKPFLCVPCVIGWHEDCVTCYCKCKQ